MSEPLPPPPADAPPPAAPPAPPPSPPPPPDGVTQDDRTLAMLAHLSAIVAGFVGPLILWLIKKDTSPFVAHHGKEALNFQISVLIGFAALSIVACIPIVGLVAFPAMLALGIGGLICVVMAGMKANEGVLSRYPYSFRFIK